MKLKIYSFTIIFIAYSSLLADKKDDFIKFNTYLKEYFNSARAGTLNEKALTDAVTIFKNKIEPNVKVGARTSDQISIEELNEGILSKDGFVPSPLNTLSQELGDLVDSNTIIRCDINTWVSQLRKLSLVTEQKGIRELLISLTELTKTTISKDFNYRVTNIIKTYTNAWTIYLVLQVLTRYQTNNPFRTDKEFNDFIDRALKTAAPFELNIQQNLRNLKDALKNLYEAIPNAITEYCKLLIDYGKVEKDYPDDPQARYKVTAVLAPFYTKGPQVPKNTAILANIAKLDNKDIDPLTDFMKATGKSFVELLQEYYKNLITELGIEAGQASTKKSALEKLNKLHTTIGQLPIDENIKKALQKEIQSIIEQSGIEISSELEKMGVRDLEVREKQARDQLERAGEVPNIAGARTILELQVNDARYLINLKQGRIIPDQRLTSPSPLEPAMQESINNYIGQVKRFNVLQTLPSNSPQELGLRRIIEKAIQKLDKELSTKTIQELYKELRESNIKKLPAVLQKKAIQELNEELSVIKFFGTMTPKDAILQWIGGPDNYILTVFNQYKTQVTQPVDPAELTTAINTANTELTSAGAGPYVPAVAKKLAEEAKKLTAALEAYNNTPGIKDPNIQTRAEQLIEQLTQASTKIQTRPLPTPPGPSDINQALVNLSSSLQSLRAVISP